MKRIKTTVIAVLVLLTLGMYGCSGGGTKLTLSNYDQYLNVEVFYTGGDIKYESMTGLQYQDSIEVSANIYPVSQFLSFTHCEIGIRTWGTSKGEEIIDELKVRVNSDGKGYSVVTHSFDSSVSSNILGFMTNPVKDAGYEVVYVKGYVKE